MLVIITIIIIIIIMIIMIIILHKGLYQGLGRLIKRYVVERTNKAEIRPKKQSEKVESCWEIMG